MRVSLRDGRIGMSRDLLHLVQGPPGIDQEGRLHVPQVVDAQVRQPRHDPQPVPDLVDGYVGLSGSITYLCFRITLLCGTSKTS